MRKRSYTVYFIPDEEAGGYTAHIPALGIVTGGETLAEALSISAMPFRAALPCCVN